MVTSFFIGWNKFIYNAPSSIYKSLKILWFGWRCAIEELQNVGISMIQVTKHSQEPLKSVVPLFSSSRDPLYSTGVDVNLGANARLLATEGHSPQLLVNFDESTSSCRNPVISKTIRITIKNNMQSNLPRGSYANWNI